MEAMGNIAKSEEHYAAHCIGCGCQDKLMMLPHRRNGCIVGWVFICSSCEPKYKGTYLLCVNESEDLAPKVKDEKNGWSQDCSVYHCSDGDHLSWWCAICRTKQWQAWYKYAGENMLFDVAESGECGWMSEDHARAFLAFIEKTEREKVLEVVFIHVPYAITYENKIRVALKGSGG